MAEWFRNWCRKIPDNAIGPIVACTLFICFILPKGNPNHFLSRSWQNQSKIDSTGFRHNRKKWGGGIEMSEPAFEDSVSIREKPLTLREWMRDSHYWFVMRESFLCNVCFWTFWLPIGKRLSHFILNPIIWNRPIMFSSYFILSYDIKQPRNVTSYHDLTRCFFIKSHIQWTPLEQMVPLFYHIISYQQQRWAILLFHHIKPIRK